MLKIDDIYKNIIKNLHWLFANYENTITIDVTNVVEGFEYYIDTLWSKISYTAQIGDTALEILTNLQENFEGTEIIASIVNDKLVLTKQLEGYFYYFDLSNNLDYEKILSGKIRIQDQNKPDPDKSSITIKIITGLNKISEGDFIYKDDSFTKKLSKEFTLNIQAYGLNSFDYINYISNMLNLEEVVEKQDLISYYQTQPVVDVSSLLNNGIESRYSLDVFCYITENIKTSQVITQNAIINFNGEH